MAYVERAPSGSYCTNCTNSGFSISHAIINDNRLLLPIAGPFTSISSFYLHQNINLSASFFTSKMIDGYIFKEPPSTAENSCKIPLDLNKLVYWLAPVEKKTRYDVREFPNVVPYAFKWALQRIFAKFSIPSLNPSIVSILGFSIRSF